METGNLLNKNVDPSSRNNRRETPLHIAVSQYPCDYELIRQILNKGSDVNAKTRNGETPLHLVLSKDWPDYSVIRQLLIKGADPNIRNAKNNTPLHLAVLNTANCSLVKELLKHGSDPNAKNRHKNTPLHLAAARVCCGDVIRVLLEKGADPRTVNHNGDSPLHMAMSSEHCNPDVVIRLVKGGADVNRINKIGRSALHNFASTNSRSLDILKQLLRQGANVNAKDEKKDTPLHLAASNQNCSLDVIKELVIRGADVKATNIRKKTPLHSFAQFNLQSIDVLNELLIHCQDAINARDYYENTPLHFAVSNKNCTPDIIRELGRRGADINAKNVYGKNALHCFAEQNLQSMDVLRELLSNADVNAMDEVGNTPLHVAVSSIDCNRHIVQIFVEFGALLNAKNKRGRTPLHEFNRPQIASCNVEVLKELLVSGADHKVKDKDDFTALHHAAENKCMCVVKELIAAGADPNAKSCYRSALHCSFNNIVSYDVSKLLLDEGADVNALDLNARTPLQSLLVYHEWDLDVIELLLRCGSDTCSPLHEEKTPLRYVSELTSINYPKSKDTIISEDLELPDCCVVAAMIAKFALLSEPPEIIKEVLDEEYAGDLCPVLECYFSRCVSELDEIKRWIVVEGVSMYTLFKHCVQSVNCDAEKLPKIHCTRALEMLSKSKNKIRIYAQDIEYRLKKFVSKK